MRFQNGCNKVANELRVVQFWSEITDSCDLKSRVFQTKLHSTQFNYARGHFRLARVSLDGLRKKRDCS